MSTSVKSVATSSLLQLSSFLSCIKDEHYTSAADLLLGASIGQHVRHILEFYICFQQGYAQKVVNYDLRKRDYSIEQNRTVALSVIDELVFWISNAESSALLLEGGYGEGGKNAFSISSNFDRELVYNIEHAIHHMAIIKIAGISLYHYTFPSNFGVADSTLNYQAQHVHR